jgi:hypothetical protein
MWNCVTYVYPSVDFVAASHGLHTILGGELLGLAMEYMRTYFHQGYPERDRAI